MFLLSLLIRKHQQFFFYFRKLYILCAKAGRMTKSMGINAGIWRKFTCFNVQNNREMYSNLDILVAKCNLLKNGRKHYSKRINEISIKNVEKKEDYL